MCHTSKSVSIRKTRTLVLNPTTGNLNGLTIKRDSGFCLDGLRRALILGFDGDRDSSAYIESAGDFALDRIERLDQIIQNRIGHVLVKVAIVSKQP